MEKSQKGFTLVELLIVVLVIGLLAGISIAMFGGAKASVNANSLATTIDGAAGNLQNWGAQNRNNFYTATNKKAKDSLTPLMEKISPPGEGYTWEDSNYTQTEWLAKVYASPNSYKKILYAGYCGERAETSGTMARCASIVGCLPYFSEGKGLMCMERDLYPRGSNLEGSDIKTVRKIFCPTSTGAVGNCPKTIYTNLLDGQPKGTLTAGGTKSCGGAWPTLPNKKGGTTLAAGADTIDTNPCSPLTATGGSNNYNQSTNCGTENDSTDPQCYNYQPKQDPSGTAPVLSFTSPTIAENTLVAYNGGNLSFTWNSTAGAILTAQCKLDDGSFKSCGASPTATTQNFSNCGIHKLTVKAANASNDVSGEIVRNFKVDCEPITWSITSSPSDPTSLASPYDQSTLNQSVAFSRSSGGTATSWQCNKGSGWNACNSTYTSSYPTGQTNSVDIRPVTPIGTYGSTKTASWRNKPRLPVVSSLVSIGQNTPNNYKTLGIYYTNTGGGSLTDQTCVVRFASDGWTKTFANCTTSVSNGGGGWTPSYSITDAGTRCGNVTTTITLKNETGTATGSSTGSYVC